MDSNNQWHVGAMNDALFIINTKPRPSNDDVWYERPDGPTMVLKADGLSIEDAQAICDAHNAAPQPPADTVTLGREELVSVVAYVLAEEDGLSEEEMHELVWQGNPPEPYGEKIHTYYDKAGKILDAIDAART